MIKSIITVESVSRLAGGMFDAVRCLNHALSDHDVVSDVYSLRDEFTVADIAGWPDPHPALFDVKGPAGYSPRLLSQARSAEGVDIGHAHGLWNFTNIAMRAWARKHRKPYVVSPHGMLNERALQYSCWKKRVASLLFENRFLKNAVCIRALTMGEARSIRALGVTNPICIVPNGVHISGTSDAVAPTPSKRQELLYLGRIHPGKNLANLIRAWGIVGKQRPEVSDEWVLKIVGEPFCDYDKELIELVKSLNLERSVVLSGAVYGSEKSNLYSSASAFVLPSLFEALPTAVLEAWSHGLPVLITPECNLLEGYDVGAAIEIGCGSSGIVHGLNKVISMSDADRVSMGRCGLQLIEERYSWSDVASKMKMVYDWALGGGPPPDCVMRNNDES